MDPSFVSKLLDEDEVCFSMFIQASPLRLVVFALSFLNIF